MMRETLIILTAGAFLSFSNGSQAGTVSLVSNTWDFICTVEVSVGLNAPNTQEVQTFKDVQRGQLVYSKATDRLCYRRSGDPENCSSFLNDWRCDASLLDGGHVDFELD